MTPKIPSYIIYYDGHCGLCQASVQWIFRRDAKRMFGFVPLAHATELPAELADVNSVVLRDKDGNVYIRSRAVSHICYLLGWPWRGFYYLSKLVSVGLADKIYNFVAANRHRWQKKVPACDLPESVGKTN